MPIISTIQSSTFEYNPPRFLQNVSQQFKQLTIQQLSLTFISHYYQLFTFLPIRNLKISKKSTERNIDSFQSKFWRPIISLPLKFTVSVALFGQSSICKFKSFHNDDDDNEYIYNSV